MTARTNQVVHSGMYLMKTNAINAATNIKYACCSIRGPFQCIQIIPITAKFHMNITRVGKSIATLYALNNCLKLPLIRMQAFNYKRYVVAPKQDKQFIKKQPTLLMFRYLL